MQWRQMYTVADLMPKAADFATVMSAKLSYETARAKASSEKDFKAWTDSHWNQTPWGLSYKLSQANHRKAIAKWQSNGSNPKQEPKQKTDIALRYFIVAVIIDWQELIDQLKRTITLWGVTSSDLKEIADSVWQEQSNAETLAQMAQVVSVSPNVILTEAIEKHDKLNSKLFTKDEELKDVVKDKLLEIVDTFVADLKEQDIKIKIDDILLIGSNASYNYTKDSDIDLHILTNSKSTDYSVEVAAALYSAYRSLFNKQLDIKIYGIPLELFVETEDSARVSNGIYSVKKNKWIKKPVHEDIPEYDKEKLNTLVSKWETKCKDLIIDIKADKLNDELKVVKLLEDIYDKLRKKGISKGEYSEENLAFKELRNKGYLDDLKSYRNELISKRLSLTEKLNEQTRRNAYAQIAQAAGSTPIIQDNGMFFIYNLKARDIDGAVRRLRSLDIVENVWSSESGKYDFSRMPMAQLPDKFYNIRGQLINSLI